MRETELETAGGVRVIRTATALDPAQAAREFDALVTAVATRRGGVIGSGMEFPGRYTLWRTAYLDPCLEVVAHGRRVAIRPLNPRGTVLLPAVAAAVLPTGEVRAGPGEGVEVFVPPAQGGFTEEERSRQPSVFTVLRAITELFRCADSDLGLYGAFGYDLALQFEPLRLAVPRPAEQRDLVLHLADELLIIDGRREVATRVGYDFLVDGTSTAGLPRRTPAAPPAPAARILPPQPAPGAFARLVERAKDRFAAGDLFEVTPAQALYGRCGAPDALFRRLREANPAPYEFLFNLGDGEYLVGASPEMYVRVSPRPDGLGVETCPIAGTIRRGGDALRDAEQIRALLMSAKDEAELTMCTDVDRNDKSRVCVPGTVEVVGRRQIELYSRLIHTVDHVTGLLRPGFDAFDAFLTHMWAVTVTGAPKTWARQFIEDHERAPRRWYGGAVGKVGFDGSLDTGLTLRTAQIRDGVAAVYAGATLLFESAPEEEERETRLKASALLAALGAAPGASPGTAVRTGGPVAGGLARREPVGAGMQVLLVDHEDSFVHTLADYFRQHGASVRTVRCGFAATLLDEPAPDLVVLSPGPGRPADFGMAALLTELADRRLPVFGVCLGLQAMVEHTGGRLRRLDRPAHGTPGRVKISGGMLLRGLPDEFTAARYHSLYATPDQVGGDFEVTASSGDVVMAIEDRPGRRWAVQFHPESILSTGGDAGSQVIANVLGLAYRAR